MRAKITNKLVGTLDPKDRLYSVRDTEIKGFLLRVSPSGGMVYYLDYRTRKGVRKSYRIGGGLKPAQARDVAEKLAADVALGVDIQEKRQQERADAKLAKARTLRGFLEHKYGPWVKTNRKTGAETLARIEFNFAALMGRSLEDINVWVLEKWRSERKRAGKAGTTINRDVVALKAVLSKAVQWKIIEVHPLADLKPLKVDKHPRVRYLLDDEEDNLRSALVARDAEIKEGRASANRWRQERGYAELPDLLDCHYGDHLSPMVLLSLNTGLRRGEAFNLQWREVNFHSKIVTVAGAAAKSGQTRHINLNDEALTVLRNWKAQGNGTGYVFPGKGGGRLDNIRNSWAGVLKKASITDFRWHDLRHDFASKLVMEGIPLNSVRELLGHSDLMTTLRYAHLAPDHKAAAVAALSRRYESKK